MAKKLVPIAAPIRSAVEAAMRGSRRSVAAIAEETGVLPDTIQAWNRRHGWRPSAGARGIDPARWSAARRGAVGRLYRQSWVDVGDLGLAMGVTGRRAEALFAACGLAGRRPGEVASEAGPGTGPRRLRAALRAHIARQIVRFDAALSAADGDAPKSFDSARVLRDLGGLKRLLDEADQDARAHEARDHPIGEPGAGDGTAFDGDPASPGAGDDRPAEDLATDDLPALRAEIARRLAALCGERPDSGAAGEPAAAPDPGAGG